MNWKQYKDTEYMVSECGKVASTKFNKFKILSQHNHIGGYKLVGLQIDGKGKLFLVHRLVAETYIKNINNLLEINHINAIRNDNRLENLEWCDRSHNMKCAYLSGNRNEHKPMAGKKHSEQTKLKMRLAKLGKTFKQN